MFNNICYKAKLKHNDAMITGVPFCDNFATMMRPCDQYGNIEPESYEIDPDTLNIFTGMILENNIVEYHADNRIFVGDNIKDVINDINATVIWDHEEYRFAVRTEYDEIFSFRQWTWDYTVIV